jgi:hypothetical protein
MLAGDERVDNTMNARTSARIYSLEAALGLWRGLGFRVGLPILDIDYSSENPVSGQTEHGHDTDVGDLWFRLGYTYAKATKRGFFRAGAGLGLSLPTGGQLAADLPANASFASRTVNPLFHLDLSYDFRFGLGFYLVGDARWVPYARDNMQSGSAFLYGGGIRYALFKRLYPSLGLYALHRLPDRLDGDATPNSGIDSVYVAIGLGYSFRYKPLRGFSLHTTLLIPAYHYTRGTQLVEKLNFTISIRYGFDAWKPRLSATPDPPAPDPLPRHMATR